MGDDMVLCFCVWDKKIFFSSAVVQVCALYIFLQPNREKKMQVAWMLLWWVLGVANAIGIQRVPLTPSSTLPAQMLWPNYNSLSCAVSEGDDTYLFSSNVYSYAQCSRLQRRVEVVHMNASAHVQEDGIQAFLFEHAGCSGQSVGVEHFYTACRYQLSFESGKRVYGNVFSVRVPEGLDLRLYDSCSGNAAPRKTISGGAGGTCVDLTSSERQVQLYVLKDSARILRRTVVGPPTHYDHLLATGAVGGSAIADNVVACTVTRDRVLAVVNDFRRCGDVLAGVLLMSRGAEFSGFVPLQNCPHVRDISVISDAGGDAITAIVACAGHTAGGTPEAQLRRIHLGTGAFASYTISTVYTDKLYQHTQNIVISPFKLVRISGTQVVVLGLRWQDLVIAAVASDAEKFANANHTTISFVDTVRPPDAVSFDAVNNLIYMVSEHRLVAWDVSAMRIRERNPACGTTALEMPDMFIYNLQADPTHGFVYAIDSRGMEPGVVAVRATGLEFEQKHPLRLAPEIGYLHGIHPMYEGNGKYSNFSKVFNTNITTVVRPHLSQARMVMASAMYGPTPPLILMLTLNGCALGKAGVDFCTPCTTGMFADAKAMQQCKRCSAGKFAQSNESKFCSACSPGLYAMLESSTRCESCGFGTFSNVQGASACHACPKDHYHLLRGATRATDCLRCPKGFVADQGSSACTKCPPGTRKTAVATCTLCPLGYYGGGGDALCVACPVGQYGAINGSVLEVEGCNECPRGRVGQRQALKGHAACDACPKGRFRAEGAPQQCNVCPEGYFSSERGKFQCTECPAGSKTLGENRMVCLACAAGMFDVGGNSCVPCPANTYNAAEGAPNEAACLPCDPGSQTVTAGSSSASQCVACSAGKARSSGEPKCSLCQAGQTAQAEGSHECQPCPAGFYETNSRTECRACSAGTHQHSDGSTACDACTQGTFSRAEKATECEECPKGYFTESEFSTGCFECGAGTFKHVAGLGACQQCSRGTFSTEVAANSSAHCKPCPAGWWATPTLTSCVACDQGHYNPLHSQSTPQACTACPAGTFGKRTGANHSGMCAECDAGRYSKELGSSTHESCLPCAPGMYRNSPGAGSEDDCAECSAGFASASASANCFECAPGTFSSGASSDCTFCPADRHAPEPASLSCVACPEGAEPSSTRTECVCSTTFYSANGSGLSECKVCPSVAVCDRTNITLADLHLKRGYWRHAETSLEIRRCPEPAACTGGAIVNSSTDAMCREGHTGPLCAVCMVGYAKTRDGICAPCPPEKASLNMAVTVLAPLALTAIVVVMVVTANGDLTAADDNRFSAILKITSSMLQVYTVCSAFDVRWPSLLVTIFERSDALNPTLGFYSAQCSFGWTYFGKSYVYMTLPPLYVGVALLAIAVSSRCLAEEGQRRTFIKHWGQTATVVGLFLMYTAVLKSLFRGLACDRVGGNYYLSTDYSIRCYEGEHARFIAPAVLCLVVYGAGIPLTAIGLIWRWRFSLHEEGARPLQFLHRGYRRERYFWEVVIVVRKVVVISMSIFMFTGDTMTRYQSPVASWFFVGCLILHLTCQPFDPLTEYGRVCNSLEASAIAACICTLNAGIIFGTHTQDYDHGVFEGLVLIFTIVINSIVAALFGYHIFRSGLAKGKESCRKVLKLCCFRHPPRDPSRPQPPLRQRRHSIHKWVHGGEEYTEERKREIELEQRTPETAALDHRLKSQRSMKLKALHAEIESSQRRRMFNLDRDSERVHEALHGADPDTAAAFRTDWERHLQDLVEKMQLTPVHSEASQSAHSAAATKNSECTDDCNSTITVEVVDEGATPEENTTFVI